MSTMKAGPQGDKSAARKKVVPAMGPDDDTKTRQVENMTAPKMPQRDGPARMAPKGLDAGKPKTAASIKITGKKDAPMAKGKPSSAAMASMKADVKKMGRFTK